MKRMKITFHQWEVKVCFKTLVSPPAPPVSSLCAVVQEANVCPSRETNRCLRGNGQSATI